MIDTPTGTFSETQLQVRKTVTAAWHLDCMLFLIWRLFRVGRVLAKLALSVLLLFWSPSHLLFLKDK